MAGFGMMADISSHGDLMKGALYNNNDIKWTYQDLPCQQWLAAQLPLVPVNDLPDHLLCPGGPTLGVGTDQHIIWSKWKHRVCFLNVKEWFRHENFITDFDKFYVHILQDYILTSSCKLDVLYKLIGQTKVCAPPNWFVTNVNRPIADLCVKLNC